MPQAHQAALLGSTREACFGLRVTCVAVHGEALAVEEAPKTDAKGHYLCPDCEKQLVTRGWPKGDEPPFSAYVCAGRAYPGAFEGCGATFLHHHREPGKPWDRSPARFHIEDGRSPVNEPCRKKLSGLNGDTDVCGKTSLRALLCPEHLSEAIRDTTKRVRDTEAEATKLKAYLTTLTTEKG